MTQSSTPPLPESVERFPDSPGVYIMKGADGKILYIGKAINLKSRVKSYFLNDHDDRRHIPFMLQKLHAIDWIATNSETEALILEANMIRSHKPPYNIDLKDDKHYPYLKVTLQEPFPRLLVVRRVENDGGRYFGPYTDPRAMRRVIHYAKRIFGIRDCNRALPLSTPARPCINHAMGRCSGACAGKITREEYRANIDLLMRFLKGRRTELLTELKRQMLDASEHLDFEHAARLRDQIAIVNESAGTQRVDLKLPDGDIDVFGLHTGDRDTCLAILQFREGVLTGKRHYLFKRDIWDIAGENHDHLVLQYYLHTAQDLPGEVLLSQDAGLSVEGLQEWFASRPDARVAVLVPRIGAKKQMVTMAERNAQLHLVEKAPSQPAQDIADLQQALGLPVPPSVIEAFDISNLGESFAVAGMVRFVNGVPDKSGYRRYKIKTVTGQDDFAMMMEVVTRRMTRIEAEGKTPADLFLIDGGKGQLGSAAAALARFANAPMIVSLAKQEEEIFMAGTTDPIRLPATHPGRKLLERVRNEVHRWAITYHRKLRGKQFGRSSLEALPGLGPSTARALLRQFGSITRLKMATVSEIAQVKGFTRQSAEALKEKLTGL